MLLLKIACTAALSPVVPMRRGFFTICPANQINFGNRLLQRLLPARVGDRQGVPLSPGLRRPGPFFVHQRNQSANRPRAGLTSATHTFRMGWGETIMTNVYIEARPRPSQPSCDPPAGHSLPPLLARPRKPFQRSAHIQTSRA